jgi:hypothetical protein
MIKKVFAGFWLAAEGSGSRLQVIVLDHASEKV